MSFLRSPSTFLLTATSLLIAYSFSNYLTSAVIISVDLPGHIEIIERLSEQLLRGRITFYDPYWFSGWPAFQFYGFFAHLVTAICSLPLAFVSSEPARLAVHFFSVLGLSLLPFSLYFAALPIARQLRAKSSLSSEERGVLALFASAFALWFINHEDGNLGLGGSAPLLLGTYSQLWAWHLGLLHLGALYRVLAGEKHRDRVILTLSFSLLLVTHLLTALFAGFFTLLAFLWFSEKRNEIFLCHVIGALLMAWWLIPLLDLLGSYTMVTVFEPRGDIVESFLKYPVMLLFNGLISLFKGNLVPLDPTAFLFIILSITMLSHSQVRRSGVLLATAAFVIVGLVIFSSAFLARTLGIGIHYYRFIPHAVLVMLTLFASLPVVFLPQVAGSLASISRITLGLCGAGSVLASIIFPSTHFIRLKAVDSTQHLFKEEKLLETIGSQHKDGRVFFEHLASGPGVLFPTPHYLESRLRKVTGRETVNGLFVENSLASVFSNISAAALGADTYKTDIPLGISTINLTHPTALQQFRDLNVSLIAAVHEPFVRVLEQLNIPKVYELPPYQLFDINAGAGRGLVSALDTPVLGYLDLSGKLPFKAIETIFQAREQLSSVDLVEISDEIPSQLDFVIVHATQDAYQEFVDNYSGRVRTFHLPLIKRASIDSYNPEETGDREMFASLERQVIGPWEEQLSVRLDQKEKTNKNVDSSKIEFDWLTQKMRATDLIPDRIYRINYAHFPYWNSEDGTILRGSSERIFFIPSSRSALITFSRWNQRSSWLGAWLSIASFMVGLLLVGKRSPATSASGRSLE